MELGGFESELTGTWCIATSIGTVCMVVNDGSGAELAALVCTNIVCEFCRGTIMVTGAESVPTGLCIVEITTTSQRVGSGRTNTDELDAINTACGFFGGGMVGDGTGCVPTGVSGAGIASTTVSMAARDGSGEAIGALVCICTVIEVTGEIIRVAGDVFVLTGTCGGEGTTTDQPDGSGDDTDGLAGICTVCVLSNGGLAPAGSGYAATGTCTAGITTTTNIMVVSNGVGDDSAGLVCIGIVCVLCTATIKVTGVASARTGTCGGATITTSHVSGHGAASVVSDAISIVFAF